MICPYCDTVNRDERDTCYQCERDLKMLRLLVNKAKHHFNIALEHAERGRREEAIVELHNALSYDNSNAQAHVLLGTLFGQQEQFDKAREEWERALKLDPSMEKAHLYIEKAEVYSRSLPALRFYRLFAALLLVVVVAMGVWIFTLKAPRPVARQMREGMQAYTEGNWGDALDAFQTVVQSPAAAESTRTLAESMASAIEENVERLAEEVDRNIQSGDYLQALRKANDLTRRGLRGEMGQKAEVLVEQMPERIRSDLAQSIDFFRRSGTGFSRVQGRVRAARIAIREGLLDQDRFDALLDQAEQARRLVSDNELALIRIEWLQTENDEAALVRLFGMTQGFGEDLQNEAREFYDSLLQKVAGRLRESVERDITEGRYDEARAEVDNRLKFFPKALQREILETVGSVEDMIESDRARIFWEQALDLFEAENRPAFIELVGEVDSFPGLSEPRREDLGTTATVFRRAIATEFFNQGFDLRNAEDWQAVLELEEKAADYDLSEEQAEGIRNWVEEARAVRGQPLVDELVALVEAEDWRAVLVRLEAAVDAVLSSAQHRQLEEWRGQAETAIAQSAVAEVSRLIDDGLLDEAIEKAEGIRALGLPEEQEKALDEILEGIQRRRVELFLEELFESLDSAFSKAPGNDVPEEAARRVVEEFDVLLETVPSRQTYHVRQLLFYRAAANVVLGNNETAREQFKEFLDQYRGDYTQSAEEYLETIRERIGEPVEQQDAESQPEVDAETKSESETEPEIDPDTQPETDDEPADESDIFDDAESEPDDEAS